MPQNPPKKTSNEGFLVTVNEEEHSTTYHTLIHAPLNLHSLTDMIYLLSLIRSSILFLQLALPLFNVVSGCSFIVTNFNTTIDELNKANYYIQFRGPDATNVENINGWTFLHNLLSMTGTPTLQPFSDDDVVALFNGEIYNYLNLAEQLSGDNNQLVVRSDGHVLIPAYRKWGREFIKHLHGEFAIILVDFRENVVVLSTDVFSTKPLWYGSYDCSGTVIGKCFVAASYETGLEALGVPASERHMADANQVVVLSIVNSTFSLLQNYRVFDFDLKQYKNTTDDWQEAFIKAVMVRVTGIKHRLFIGLSGGFDSGAIMLALEMLQKNLFAYHVKTRADSDDIIKQRIDFCQFAESTIIEVSQDQYNTEKQWLEKRCEPYQYQEKAGGQYGINVYEDKASIGLSLILQQVRKLGGLIYLSGSGADETISDYGINGNKIFGHSNFAGVFPTKPVRYIPLALILWGDTARLFNERRNNWWCSWN